MFVVGALRRCALCVGYRVGGRKKVPFASRETYTFSIHIPQSSKKCFRKPEVWRVPVSALVFV